MFYLRESLESHASLFAKSIGIYLKIIIANEAFNPRRSNSTTSFSLDSINYWNLFCDFQIRFITSKLPLCCILVAFLANIPFLVADSHLPKIPRHFLPRLRFHK